MLVGNPPLAPALEFMFVDGEYELAADMGHVAVTGAASLCSTMPNGYVRYRSIRLVREDVLRIGAAPDAVWGASQWPKALRCRPSWAASRRTCDQGLGGLAGRALMMGDARGVGGRDPRPCPAARRLVLDHHTQLVQSAAVPGETMANGRFRQRLRAASRRACNGRTVATLAAVRPNPGLRLPACAGGRPPSRLGQRRTAPSWQAQEQ